MHLGVNAAQPQVDLRIAIVAGGLANDDDLQAPS